MDGLGKFFISNEVPGTLKQLVLEVLACHCGPSHGVFREFQP